MSWGNCENNFRGAMAQASDNPGVRQLAFGLAELTKELRRLDHKVEEVKDAVERIQRQTR